MARAGDLEIFGIDGVPEVRAGDDLVGIIVDAVGRAGRALEGGDVVVVTHKIVSKAEGRLVDLREIQPSAFAYHLASTADKDPRQVEVVLRESVRIVRM